MEEMGIKNVHFPIILKQSIEREMGIEKCIFLIYNIK